MNNKAFFRYYTALILATALNVPLTAQNATSHTFFTVRPQFQSASPEMVSLFYDRMTARCDDGAHGGLEIVLFGGKSRNAKNNCNPLTSYFLPFNKSELLVGEFGSQAVIDETVDVIANYFGVLTADPSEGVGPDQYNFTNGTFESIISYNPRQIVTGVGFYYKQKLNRASNAHWISISFPLVHVTNKLGFTEEIIDEGGGDVQPGYVATVGDALRGDIVFGDTVFEYGKVPRCSSLSVTKIADIECKLGRTCVTTDDCYFDGYIGVVLPTGNKPIGEFIFEPIAGNNHHTGFLLGSEYGFCFWESECHSSVWFQGCIDGRYLAHNIQKRSVDLFDKQWGRYIWMYPNELAEPLTDLTPSINFLTRDVRVYPRFAFTINSAFVFTTQRFRSEIGYNRYTRQAEKVCLATPFVESFGIAGINADDTTQLVTASNATINRFTTDQGILPDTTFTPIKQENLNLESAAHPAIITNTIYAATGCKWDDREFPVFIGFGGSYEFAEDNTALNRWLVWGKGGVSF